LLQLYYVPALQLNHASHIAYLETGRSTRYPHIRGQRRAFAEE